MSDDNTKQKYEKPPLEKCEVARFDNDGHLAGVELETDDTAAEAPPAAAIVGNPEAE